MTLDLNKIYVAASSTEIERARMWMQRLAAAGFEVVSNARPSGFHPAGR